MTTLYDRKISLTIGQAGGNGLDLSDLHIVFTVRGATTQTLKTAEIRVYNLAQNTLNTILHTPEFTRVVLAAGYIGSFGTIFQGQVSKYMSGKEENATDTFLDIVACDSDLASNFTVMNMSQASGWTQQDIYNHAISAFTANGVSAGVVTPAFPGNGAPRGKVMYGMARDYMAGVSNALNAEWHIDDGKLNVCGVNDVIAYEVPDLNSTSGMLGTPKQTLSGMVVKCLLNPAIKPGGKIHINNKDVVQSQLVQAFDPADTSLTWDTDGFYKVLSRTHTGDTRGESWQTEMICNAVDETGTSPLSGAALSAVPET